MTDFARLKAKRAGHRGACTKVAKELDAILTSYEETDMVRCTTIKTLLEDKLKILNELDENILNLCDINDIENEIDEATEVTARILHVITRIEEFEKSKESSKPNQTDGNTAKVNKETSHENTNTDETSHENTNTNETSHEKATHENNPEENTSAQPDEQSTIEDKTSTKITKSEKNTSGSNAKYEETIQNDAKNTKSMGESNNTNQACGSQYVKTKLPKLTLPKFREITKWNTFWDTYESAINKKQYLSKIDKFNYLNSLLEGDSRINTHECQL